MSTPLNKPALILALIAASLLVAGIIGSCVHQTPPTRVEPPAPATAPATAQQMRDLSGKPRDRHRGLTPGALEAEGALPQERSTNRKPTS